MIEFLKGKKTYILGALTILATVVKFLSGDLTLTAALNDVWGIIGGLGLITLRAGITTEAEKAKS